MSADVATAPAGAPARPRRLAGAPGRRRARQARPLVWASGLIALALVLPLVFLVIEAATFGWSSIAHLVFRGLTASLLWHTVSLTAAVTACCAVLGTATAWCVERTDLPGRRLWAALVVVPVGIPDFAVAFGWRSLFDGIGGFGGALLVMTLAVYPLVFLPVAASLRDADPAHEEVARSLGVGGWGTYWRVTVGQARTAVLGGSLLVALVVLAEYGAFEILGYQTFTTEIFTESQVGFNAPAACGLSLVLVLVGLVLVVGERALQGRRRGGGDGTGAGPAGGTVDVGPRPGRQRRLGRSAAPVVGGFVTLTTFALGVPLAAIAYWLVRGGRSTIPAASISSAIGHTAIYGCGAGLLATALAVPVALLSIRHPARIPMVIERSTYLVLAIPGLIIALALTYVSQRYAAGFLYQSSYLLIVAYAIMFFPLALVAVRASVVRAPRELEELGRSLGASRAEVLWRVTLPLVAPGLAAAFCLVFLEAVTELTATLVLIPTNAQTLATQFWAYQSNTSYGQAAPYAALMVIVAAVPSYVLGRWFDRMPARRAVTT
ncbi:MAG: ABC transporter permease [Acidimicrobiales bacterium]